MTNLERLSAEFHQSPWLDNLGRDLIQSGQLGDLVIQGVLGVTSNPTIFQKSIEAGTAYDADFKAAILDQVSTEEAYWRMVKADVVAALSILRPVYDNPGNSDGYVSLEVSPRLAHDTAATITSARELHAEINQPNLMVKIPATIEGIPAIKQMIADGRSINVTLIFSLERYAQVIEAYLSGLEVCQEDLSQVHSVASFFISRVDTEVDQRLDDLKASPNDYGKAALAQAALAYDLFQRSFAGPRWEALAARGANLQRPLWASTSTKNPSYPDLLYVDNLAWPNTVNTMPDATIAAVQDHANPKPVDLLANLSDARAALDRLTTLGINIKEVDQVLEDQGVANFKDSYEELLARLESKKAA